MFVKHHYWHRQFFEISFCLKAQTSSFDTTVLAVPLHAKLKTKQKNVSIYSVLSFSFLDLLYELIL
jgi:hypothetical protein